MQQGCLATGLKQTVYTKLTQLGTFLVRKLTVAQLLSNFRQIVLNLVPSQLNPLHTVSYF
jgi:hypothetical protein